MSHIDLQAGKINFEAQWLSVDDLVGRIQEKMNAGDMKFSEMASALEELNRALENSHTIETKITIPTAAYEKLKALGGEDDLACVHKAIMAFIQEDVSKAPVPEPAVEPAVEPAAEPAAEPEGKKQKVIKCAKCKAAIEIPAGEKPTEIECPECGTVGRLKSKNKSDVKHQDHFLG